MACPSRPSPLSVVRVRCPLSVVVLRFRFRVCVCVCVCVCVWLCVLGLQETAFTEFTPGGERGQHGDGTGQDGTACDAHAHAHAGLLSVRVLLLPPVCVLHVRRCSVPSHLSHTISAMDHMGQVTHNNKDTTQHNTNTHNNNKKKKKKAKTRDAWHNGSR